MTLQPHLKVAMRMIDEGKVVSAGDHIPYVVCKVRSRIFAPVSLRFYASTHAPVHAPPLSRSSGGVKREPSAGHPPRAPTHTCSPA